MTSIRRAGLAGAAIISAFVFGACGGAAATATPATDATPTPPVVGAIPSFDLSGLVKNLEGVDSYKVTITANGKSSYSAIVVTKPVLARDVTMGDATRIVVIGDEAWIGTGDDLKPAPKEMATPMLAAFDPIALVGAFSAPGAMLGATEVGSEEKNGVQTRHFTVAGDSFVGAAAALPPGSSIEMWVAEEGYLVSMSIAGTGAGTFTMDVTDVNDASNVVERPS